MTDLLAVMNKEEPAKAAFADLNRRFVALEQIQSAEYRAAPLAAMYFHLARVGWNPKQANDRTLDTLEKILDLPQVQRAGVGQAAVTAELYYEFARLERKSKHPTTRLNGLVEGPPVAAGPLGCQLETRRTLSGDNKLPPQPPPSCRSPLPPRPRFTHWADCVRGGGVCVAGNFAESAPDRGGWP